jgi:hypothetical protein
VPCPQGVRGVIRGLPRARLLRPRRTVHLRGAVRVWAQLQHLNPNNIQQMAAFKAMCEGYLGISARWHLFRYFFMFTCLKESSRAATIGCANV